VTGHLQDDDLDLDWPCLTRPGQTVVFYMARVALDLICRRLREHGLPDDWPAAMVVDGATRHQWVAVGDLAGLPARVAAEAPAGPGLLIVGEVVRLHRELGWYTRKED
jgi:uroporphyrin-III C-methyltransferase/precorrin-2 dehydrogenase/sirohydrochlorin ferrochelatase